jgi:Patatin-like phospholipase
MAEAHQAPSGAGSGPDPGLHRELLPCDLVLKGGITSGVVYPRLIARLAQDYQFKCIGGTSAGAIAAAGCAAAELGRQTGANPRSFEHLAGLPDELKADFGTPTAPRLFHLFQPAPDLRSHFAVLEGALNAPDTWAAVKGASWALLRQYWALALVAGAGSLATLTPSVMGTTGLSRGPALGCAVGLLAAWLLALGLAVTLPSGPKRTPLLAAFLAVSAATVAIARSLSAPWSLGLLLSLACAVTVPLAIALALGLVSWRFGLTLLRGLHANKLGLCSGATEDRPRKGPGLTEWLSSYFDTLAGRNPKDRPLTFGDLWGAPPDEGNLAAKVADKPAAERLVNLEMVTTAVSQQMCYSIPFRGGHRAFYYDPAEWAELFPPRIMSWLGRVADAEGEPFRITSGAFLRKLPPNGSLPVVVGVRMSLSFPVLLSAVPLFAIDFSDLETPDRGMKRVWFSDGGISSNLPLHFFDAPLPGRPTFAVNLKGEHPAHRVVRTGACAPENGRVYLPTRNSSGLIRHWYAARDETPGGLARFFWDIIYTMQSWRDEIQFPQPGYRDRIVQISQLPDEGGLNLKMPGPVIDALSEAGLCAGQRLVQRFHPASTAAEKGGWENHEEVRARTFLHTVAEMITHPRVADSHWEAVVDRCRAKGRYDNAEADLALEVLRALRELGGRIRESPASLETDAPKPQPTMRIAPRI